MDKVFNFVSMLIGSVGGVLIYIFGGIDVIMKTLLILIVLDYITGVLKAVYEKKLNSQIGFRGIIKKTILMTVVAAAVAIQNVIDMPVREIIITFFICNEAISLLENAGAVIPIPGRIKNMLERLRDDNISKLDE